MINGGCEALVAAGLGAVEVQKMGEAGKRGCGASGMREGRGVWG